MAKIKNMDGLTDAEINHEIANGARFVMYQYCISIILMTFRRSSDLYYIRPGESSFKYGIGYTLLTFFLGWWGIPWGPIYTIGSLYTNLTGGKDMTQAALSTLDKHP